VKISIDLNAGAPQRSFELSFAAEELHKGWLTLAHPEGRNRTDRYLRRHPRPGSTQRVDPNRPQRIKDEPPKLTIPEHLARLRAAKSFSEPVPKASDQGEFMLEPYRLVITASDLVANLLRPAFHQGGLGGSRVFYLQDEPIDRHSYLCLTCQRANGNSRLDLQRLRFDVQADSARDAAGADLAAAGLEWAAAVVPLVEEGQALSATQIAQHDYDLRQILGRQMTEAMIPAYEGWFNDWDRHVAEAVAEHERRKLPYEVFYHNIVAIDGAGRITIVQFDTSLPAAAAMLAERGMVAAGVLDSGGSCAVYDVWLDAYLNHGWYFRQPRGAVITLEFAFPQRLPHPLAGSWVDRRGKLA
jgi:hypothetical protein